MPKATDKQLQNVSLGLARMLARGFGGRAVATGRQSAAVVLDRRRAKSAGGLRWETRDGEKGRFANGARASYRITTTRTYTGPTYRLTRRERVSGPWTFMGLFNFLAEARGAADIHENA